MPLLPAPPLHRQAVVSVKSTIWEKQETGTPSGGWSVAYSRGLLGRMPDLLPGRGVLATWLPPVLWAALPRHLGGGGGGGWSLNPLGGYSSSAAHLQVGESLMAQGELV